MEEITVYKYQLELIENALRLTNNINKCSNKKDQTSFDRDVVQALGTVKNLINGDKETLINRFK